MVNYLVENLEYPIRLDKYIKKLLPSINQALIEKFIREKIVKLNSLIITKSNVRIKNMDSIYISDLIVDRFTSEITQKKKTYLDNPKLEQIIKKSIIYENENIIVINKPSGIACQGGTKLIHSIDEIMNSVYNTQIRIVHRLDKETSGILLLAKNLKYAKLLTQLFREKKIEKVYHAICERASSITEYMIDQYIDQILDYKEIVISTELITKTIGDQEKICVKNSSNGNAETKIQLLKKLKNNLFFFEIKPKSGKKHQIRVHLQYISFPILGDTRYNYSKIEKRLMLHASKIVIPQLKLEFNCPIPHRFKSFLV